MMMAGIDTFTAVMAILFASVTSSSDLILSDRVLRYIGIDVIAATPLIFSDPVVRPQVVRNAGGPAGTRWAAPEISASLTTAGPPRLM